MNLKTALTSCAFLILAACASTAFQSTWKSPEASRVPLKGKKIVVIVPKNVPKSQKTSMEAAVSDELKKAGAAAVAAFQELAPNATIEEAKAKLARDGFDAAFIVHATNKESEISSPAAGMSIGMVGPYGGVSVGTPTVTFDTKLYIEIIVYAVKADKIAWSGLSVTTNPKDIESLSRDLTYAALHEMQMSGLLE